MDDDQTPIVNDDEEITVKKAPVATQANTLPISDDYADMEDDDQTVASDDLILIDDQGKFLCAECENYVNPQITGEEGSVNANIDLTVEELTETPGKTIYTFCPVCGMEYQFKLTVDGLLGVLPSDEEK